MIDFFRDKKIRLILFGLLGFFLAGALFFTVYHKWIIFSFPSYKTEVDKNVKEMRPEKKEVVLQYYYNKKWRKEKVNLLWPEDKAMNIKYLVNSWLNLLEEDQVVDYKVSLQTVLVASSGDQVYLSFDRKPFEENSSTHEKLMWIEGLLKTMRENDIKMRSIYFLVHHQVMQDYHLDFAHGWPINGFLDI